jgi:hypothetical protein
VFVVLQQHSHSNAYSQQYRSVVAMIRLVNSAQQKAAFFNDQSGVLHWFRLKTSTELYVEDASVSKTTWTSSDRQQQARYSRLECHLRRRCVDRIIGITSTNKTVLQLLSRIICVVVVIEPTPIHSIAYIHHPATPTKLIFSKHVQRKINKTENVIF